MPRRVVVTGVGLVTALGIGTDVTWEAIRAGKCGIGPITQFDATAFSCRIAGEVKGFDPAAFIEKKEIKKMGRFIQFSIAAAEFALRGSALKIAPEDAERVGVYIGSGIGGFEVIEREHQTLLEHGPRRISPFFIPATIINLASGYVSIRSGAKGPNSATATACTTSAHSIGDSFRLIQHNDADAMICGGTEACITPMGIGGFAAMRALSTRNDEPQRRRARGTRTAMGSWWAKAPESWCWKSWNSRAPAGRNILAEVVGYGMSADAFHVTAPPDDGDGAYRVMRNALRDAGLEPGQVDYINAHGTSTEVGDRAETMAIKRAFGDARLQGGGELHEVDDRPFAGWRRRIGSRHHGVGDTRSDRSADNQFGRTGSGVRFGFRAASRAAHEDR